MREFIVGCLILVAVVASRHASINYPDELSADESELLVQIDRYEHDMMPWRSVDGSTIGPINPWFLLLIKQTGWPMSYSGLHFLAAVLLGLTAVISYYTIRLFLPFFAACLVGLAGVLALGCSASVNFMYFATELVPGLALCVAVFAFVWARQGRPAPLVPLTLAAVCSGISPWAKLQAAPVSLLVAGFSVWTAWAYVGKGRPLPGRIAAVSLVIVGAALPTITIMAVVWLGGVFPDFWASYVVANVGYAGSLTAADAGSRLVQLLLHSQLNGLMAGAATLAMFCLVKSRPGQPSGNETASWIRLFACLYLGVTVFSCIRPPHGFGHYHLFLIGPLFLALGMLVHWACVVGSQDDGERIRRTRRMVAAACVLAPTCALSAYHYRAGEPLRNHLVTMQRDADRNLPAVVTREILRLAPGASTMVVWGWMPTLYVKSGLHSATRHTISHFLIDPGPSREFIREQFLREVHSARPDVIVDAVASDCFTWYWSIESSGIESFPEFAAYVKANYTLALSVMADQTGVPLRVFVRKPTDDSRL